MGVKEPLTAALLTGLAAGLLAGLLLTPLQQALVVPLIRDAEVYEQAPPAPSPASATAADATPQTTSASAQTASGHSPASAPSAEAAAPPSQPEHSEEVQPPGAWSTLAANLVTGVGFALVLAGAFLLHGGEVNWRRGLLWGLAGFASVAAAPALGLPPELPGEPAAAVWSRQLWWAFTAAATAGGLALAVFPRRVPLKLLGGVLIVLPHLIGAPHPADGVVSPVPEALTHAFIAASLGSNAAFWLVLGAGAGWLYPRLRGSPR